MATQINLKSSNNQRNGKLLLSTSSSGKGEKNFQNYNSNGNHHSNQNSVNNSNNNNKIMKNRSDDYEPNYQYQQFSLNKTIFPEVKFCNLSKNNSSSLGALSLSQNNDDSSDNNSEKLYNNNNSNSNNYNQNINYNGNNNKNNRKRLISNDSSVDESILTSTITEKKKPEIPDGGYGWVVVFASLCVSLIADGVSFSFGLIYTELNAYFHESKSKTAWVGSLFLAVPLLVGPIMSNLVDKYGCRRMTIIGGIVSASGFALGSLCNSIEMLYLTFGIISGLGLGIGYVTAVVSIAFWFDKKRTFATGIGASGTGIGTFLYAPFTQWLIEYYGWRGATLILAGTMLNTCVFGALMRDPNWLIEENRLESRSQSVTTFSNSSVCLDEIKKLLETGANKEAVLDTLVTNCNTEANIQLTHPDDFRSIKRYRSEIFLPTYFYSQNLLSIDEIKRENRRSLRNKLNDHDKTSQENLLSLSSGGAVGGAGDTSGKEYSSYDNDKIDDSETNKLSTIIKKKYLASIETLSPSEKMTTVLNTPIGSLSSHGSIQSINDNSILINNVKHEQDLFIINEKQKQLREKYKQKCLNTSRLSLNEDLVNKLINNINNDNDNESIIIKKKDFRGNSLDILRDGKIYDFNVTNEINSFDDHHNFANGIKIKLTSKEYKNGETKISNSDKKNKVDNNLMKFQKNSAMLNKNLDYEIGIDDEATIKRRQKSNLKRNISLRNANYLKNMRIHRNSIHYRGAMLNTHRYRLRASSCPNIYRNSMTTIAREDEDTWYDNFVDILKSMFDFSLFLDIKFTILNLSTLLLFIWYIIPYLYITEHMLKYNYEEDDSALVLSTIGIFSTIGMVGLGFVGDRPWLNVNISYAVCMILCGFSVALMPLVVENFVLLLIASALFGLTFASTFSFTPSIIVNLVDLDDFTIAYGLVLLVQGIGSLIGPPLAGLMYEITLRWDDAFYAGGLFISISGILAYIIEVLENREKKLKKNNQAMVN